MVSQNEEVPRYPHYFPNPPSQIPKMKDGVDTQRSTQSDNVGLHEISETNNLESVEDQCNY